MTYRVLRILVLLGVLPLVCCVAGCASVNSRLAVGMEDVIPQWAGGLPPDAPARPGTAKYDQEMKERERERLTPKTNDTAQPPNNSAQPTTNNATSAIH